MADETQQTQQSNSASIQQGASMMNASINSFATNTANRNALKKQYKYWQKSADYQNQLARENMDYQQKLAVENYLRQRDDAYSREDYLNANSKRIEVNALRDAGINPAWSQNGGEIVSSSVGVGGVQTPSPSAPSGSSFTPQQPQFVNLLNEQMDFKLKELQLKMLSEQTKAVSAQTAKTNAETKSVELETKYKIDEDTMAEYSLLNGLHTDSEGNFVDKDGNQIVLNSKENNSHLSKRGIQALKTFDEILNERSSYISSRFENTLKSAVASLQIDNSDVLKALANIPEEQYKNIVRENDGKDLENELMHLSHHIVEKYVLSSDNELVKIIGCMLYNFAQQK